MIPGIQYVVTRTASGDGPRKGDRVILRADGLIHWSLGGGLIAAATFNMTERMEFEVDREWVRARLDVLHAQLQQLEDLL